MSEPIDINKSTNPLHDAISQLVDAQSSLNMCPSPLPVPEGKNGYLSEIDKWASHAYEHICTALKLIKRHYDDHQGPLYLYRIVCTDTTFSSPDYTVILVDNNPARVGQRAADAIHKEHPEGRYTIKHIDTEMMEQYICVADGK